MKKNIKTGWAGWLILASVFLAGDLVCAPVGPPTSTSNKILFVSDRDKTKEIYMMDEFGSDQKKVLSTHFANWAPQWSPVPGKLIFYSSRDGNFQIYTMLSDGSDQRRIRSNAFSETDPVFSPDGDKIAFISTATGSEALWVMQADGSHPMVITPKESGCAHPSWSPDGKKIIYQHREGVNNVISVISADGGISRILFRGDFDAEQPSWSPQGDKIAYVVTKRIWIPEIKQKKTISNIFIAREKGNWTKQSKITFQGNSTHPAWFPGGKKLVFQSDRSGFWAIYESSWEGRQQRKVSDAVGTEQYPAVSPDGTKVAFTYELDKSSQLSFFNLKTKQSIIVANPTYEQRCPSWAIKPNEFLFTSFAKESGVITRANIEGLFVGAMDVSRGDQISPMETPDQKYYVFTLVQNNLGQIMLLDRATKKMINLSNNSFDDREPFQSPDGTQIYFESNRSGKYQIYRINMDGTFPTLLSDAKGNDHDPMVSPDGKQLVFYSDKNSAGDIYVLDLASRRVSRLTDQKDWNGNPVWSRDGSQIVFVSKRAGRQQVYKMNADGTSLINLSNNLWNDSDPAWR